MICHPITLIASAAGAFALVVGLTAGDWVWIASGVAFEAAAVALVLRRVAAAKRAVTAAADRAAREPN